METTSVDFNYDAMSRAKLRKLPAGDALNAHCPSRSVIELLADKWTLLVIWSLGPGPMRFGELRRQIEGVTQKMLTQSLRSLERDGLVTRTVYATTPPSVEYALTPLGDSITAVTGQMCRWAELNMGQVMLARRDYDQAAEPPAEPGTTTVRSGRRLAR